MSKKITGIILLSLVLILSACNGESEEPVSTESVFLGGAQGVVATFEPLGIQEGGTYTIFDTEGFPIEINLKNLGEADIEPGDVRVVLRGISLQDFSGITAGGELQNQEELEKRSELNTAGEEEILDFTPTGEATYQPEVIGFYDVNLFADVQYDYETHVIVPRVCFKEDPQDSGVCEPDGTRDFFVSGGPIGVRSVTQEVGGRGIVVLRFQVEDVGGGIVAKPGEEFISRDERLAIEVRSNPEDWECRGGGRENELRLIDGTGEVVCRLVERLETDALFTRQFELDFVYHYENTISETVRIKESLRDN